MQPQTSATTQYWIRLLPLNRLAGITRQRHVLPGGMVFTVDTNGKPRWGEPFLTERQYLYMRKQRQYMANPSSPPLFQIVTSREEFEDIVRQERKAEIKLRGVNDPNYDPELFEVDTEEASPDFKVAGAMMKTPDTSRINIRKPKESVAAPVPEPPISFAPLEALLPQTAEQKASATIKNAIEERAKKTVANNTKKKQNGIGKKS